MTEEKMKFVQRLIDVVTQLGYPEHGRQTQLAQYYKVTQGAARKWFAGEAMPSYEICADLCRRAHVHFEWLMTGRGAKAIHDAAPPMSLAYVDAVEIRLLSLFREASEDGRTAILTLAENAPRAESLSLALVNNKA